MKEKVIVILLFLWLLVLSTFILNVHLLLEPFITWFTRFYYLSYLILVVFLFVIRGTFFQKASISFGIGLWVCFMGLMFMSLQGAVLSMYGDIYGGSEVAVVILAGFFSLWSVIIAVVLSAIGLWIKFGLSKLK